MLDVPRRNASGLTTPTTDEDDDDVADDDDDDDSAADRRVSLLFTQSSEVICVTSIREPLILC